MIQIAIDGPSASGKSTIAKILAEKLQIIYIDTGAMYRGLTYYLLKNNVSPSDEKIIENLIQNIKLEFRKDLHNNQRLFVNGEDVTALIRSETVTQNVSQVSAYDFVRKALVKQQQHISKNQPVVMDGRDIGTVVLPQATLKIFLTASVETRAKRRYNENLEKGYSNQTLEAIAKDLEARDFFDSNREHSPLMKAKDAIVIDSSNLTIDEVVDEILSILEKKISC